MMSTSSKGLKFRIVFVAALCFGLLGVMILRASQLQIFRGSLLAGKAERQLTKKIDLPPVRGKILDRNGHELAINREVYSVYAQPPKVSDVTAAAKGLEKSLGEEDRKLEEKLRAKKSFVWLERNVGIEKWNAIASLNIKGIGAIKGSRRYYPNMELAGHLIGFAGIDSQGLEGLELAYNDYIKGKAGYFIAERDALGRNIFPRGLNLRDSTSGSDVVLTIDKTIQHIAERELGHALEEYDAKGGRVLIMNPHTGEVLAMAVQPAFNPNFFGKYNSRAWRNRIVTDSFEPGSTFKIFLAASAIESGKVGTQDIFYCEEGRTRIYNKYIHDSKKHGWLTMENILKVSSNIGAYKIAEKIGKDSYYQNIQDFGFGEKSNIDFPGEASGFLRPLKKISPVGFANLAFGQGVSVTAVQLVSAISAVANGGSLMKPFLVKKIIDKRGETVLLNTPTKVRQVISKETSSEVTAMLKRVVSGEGTGGRAALDGYQVAGKTGTSQKFDVKEGQYSKEKYISSFIGFLPANAPELAMLVLIDEPKEHYYGGKVAAPVFRKIAEQSLAYLQVSPLKEKNVMPLYQKVRPALKKRRLKKDKNLLFVKGGAQQMPDLTGLSLREILVKMKLPPTEMSGRGIVVEQNPLPGNLLDKEGRYKVKFSEGPGSAMSVAL